MGSTFAQSFLRAHLVEAEQLAILEKQSEKAQQLSLRKIGRVHHDPESCLPAADLVILAVKPQDAPQLFAQIRPLVDPQQLFLSIMAGVRIAQIQEALGVTKVIRAMPNLPAQLGQGMTTFTASPEVSRVELVMVQNLLNTTGKTIYVAAEEAIDASTAISGSGPAYVFYFMQAMMEAARELQFTPAEAELLVMQTFEGAIGLFRKNDLSCAEWIQRVSSRGGTTEAAMQQFGQSELSDFIKAGIRAAFERAQNLGK